MIKPLLPGSTVVLSLLFSQVLGFGSNLDQFKNHGYNWKVLSSITDKHKHPVVLTSKEIPATTEPSENVGEKSKLETIAELVSGVEILDITSFIPVGYKYHEYSDEDLTVNSQEITYDIDEVFVSKNLNRKSKNFNDFGIEEVSVKPGKLNGRLLARISKEMKEEEEEEEEAKDESDEEDRKVDVSLEFDPDSHSKTLLRNDANDVGPKVESVKPKLSRPVTSPTTFTSTAYRSSTTGVCGQFCGLTGDLKILAGLTWREELLHDFTDQFRESKRELEGLMTQVFSQVYFGRALDFCSVDAFSRLGDAVIAEFYLQFSGIVFEVSSADLKTSWVELLDVEDGNYKLGKYVIDVDGSHFKVVNTEILNHAENLVFSKYGVELPDWAWLVTIAGFGSIFIVTLLGVVLGIKRFRLDNRVHMRLLHNKTLEVLKNNSSDRTRIEQRKNHRKNRLDLWTLQRKKEKEMEKLKSEDSGLGSGSGFSDVFNQKFSSFRKMQRKSVSVNDSQAELLNSCYIDGYQDVGNGIGTPTHTSTKLEKEESFRSQDKYADYEDISTLFEEI